MRDRPSILHLDLDAFFAAVEQRDKPSLRGKPVVVGGLGSRGVVATASYEARAFGVGSAMPISRARALCPNAAFLTGRFAAYREASSVVMGLLARLSPACEAISLDECFVDLDAAGGHWDGDRVHAVAVELKAAVASATGLCASVGAGTSKLIAKIASDLDKPDGLRVVAPGTERDLLDPMPVAKLWSIGPATQARLARIGVHTVAQLAETDPDELVALLGGAHGRLLARLARADDSRAVSPHRESKSVSVEDTFERDLVERTELSARLDGMAEQVALRMRNAGLSGRTVTVKVRRADFTTLTRSATLTAPSDSGALIATTARRLLSGIETTDGIRLLGVGMSSLTDWAQQILFEAPGSARAQPAPTVPQVASVRSWRPGQDVEHATHGPGWVWGAGLGRVTVRFETRASVAAGPVHTFREDDPALTPRSA